MSFGGELASNSRKTWLSAAAITAAISSRGWVHYAHRITAPTCGQLKIVFNTLRGVPPRPSPPLLIEKEAFVEHSAFYTMLALYRSD